MAEETMQYKNGGEVLASGANNELLGDVESNEAMARLRVTVGRTVNMGNFNSYKHEITVEIPVMPEQITEKYAKMKVWMDKRIDAAIKGIE